MRKASKVNVRVWLGRAVLLPSMLAIAMLLGSCGNAASTAAAPGSAAAMAGTQELAVGGAEAPALADSNGVSVNYSKADVAPPQASVSAEGGSDASKDKGITATAPQMPEDLGRKIIREGNVSMETTDLDKTLNTLYTLLQEVGGFEESRSIQGNRLFQENSRNAQLIIRVPSKRFDEVMNGLPKAGAVTQSATNANDITAQYTDTETRTKNLKIQEGRILELIKQAPKLDEILVLEQRLSDIRTQIESGENQITNYNRLLEYSRISIGIQEVFKPTEVRQIPKTMGERLTNAFRDAWTGFVTFLEDFLVWLVANIFTLLLLALLVWVFVFILRRVNRKRRMRLAGMQVDKGRKLVAKDDKPEVGRKDDEEPKA